ncbi:hypothetical protein DSO57_1004699 [Entomophthora muscae]|uniref:Uncharacterized protein n=1 Tax=Entomophthora muscae TaxID=34485 RepID=A0ACC2SXN2_9FUNG|nr:hypothetical protein DSO57_1004699 [Entomophthora muscae]
MSSVCGICVDNFSSEPNYEKLALPVVDAYFASKYTEGIMATRCGHLFHYSCIKAWFQRNRVATCPFCNSIISARSIIKLFHDWGPENNEPISDKPTKAAFNVLKEKYAVTNTCFENTNRKLQTMAGQLKSLQKRSAELEERLSQEETNSKELEKLFRAKDLGFKEKHKILMQALSCLNQVSIITSLPKDSTFSHLFPLSQEYHHNQISIVEGVKKLREDYLEESKLCDEFRNKYVMELEAHRKTLERARIFQQLVFKIIEPPVVHSQDRTSSLSDLCLTIQELVDNSGLIPKSS